MLPTKVIWCPVDYANNEMKRKFTENDDVLNSVYRCAVFIKVSSVLRPPLLIMGPPIGHSAIQLRRAARMRWSAPRLKYHPSQIWRENHVIFLVSVVWTVLRWSSQTATISRVALSTCIPILYYLLSAAVSWQSYRRRIQDFTMWAYFMAIAEHESILGSGGLCQAGILGQSWRVFSELDTHLGDRMLLSHQSAYRAHHSTEGHTLWRALSTSLYCGRRALRPARSWGKADEFSPIWTQIFK